MFSPWGQLPLALVVFSNRERERDGEPFESVANRSEIVHSHSINKLFFPRCSLSTCLWEFPELWAVSLFFLYTGWENNKICRRKGVRAPRKGTVSWKGNRWNADIWQRPDELSSILITVFFSWEKELLASNSIKLFCISVAENRPGKIW